MEMLVGVLAAVGVCLGVLLGWQAGWRQNRRALQEWERYEERQLAKEAALIQMCRDLQRIAAEVIVSQEQMLEEADRRRDLVVVIGLKKVRLQGGDTWAPPVQWVRMRGGWFVEVVLQ